MPGSDLNSPARLAAVANTGLADAPATESMQRISRLVSRLLRAPVALATFVDDERQFFVAATGFGVEPFASQRQTPLSHSFCQHVVLRGESLNVTDSRDEAFLEGNRAIDELGVIAYLGVPLYAPDGELLGSLCAIDGKPRAWNDDDEAALTDLAELVTDELRYRAATEENLVLTARLRAEVRRDELTGLGNRRFWLEQATIQFARAMRDGSEVSVICLDLDSFKAVNDEQGHAAGDDLLVAVAEMWSSLVRTPDLLARWGGDEFVIMLGDSDQTHATEVAHRLAAASSELIEVSAGVAQWNRSETAEELLERADAELLGAKRRNRAPDEEEPGGRG